MKPGIHALLTALCGSALALVGAGCDTEAFCFDDCADGGSTETNTGAGGNGGGLAGVTVTGAGGDQSITVAVSTGSGAGGCEVTNPVELCDGIDNDCNGEIDDDIDFSDPRQCGNCETNCYQLLANVDPESITCDPPGEPGEPGICAGACAPDYHDYDGDGSCESYCVAAGNDDDTCDNKDDDCDGSLDEDVDVCTDTQNCGICGRQCVAPNAVTACVAEQGAQVCDESNTQCRISSCAPGFVDANGLYLDGCELPCVPTNGGVEICGDQIDNDCDGAIDAADDDLSGDPNVGATCFGGQATPASPLPQGVCGAAGNEGTWACEGGGYRCVGPNVVQPGELVEMCNGEDDDCDGVVDDAPEDVGGQCGVSGFLPCRFGTILCVDGAPSCIGAILPGVETCNGIDDDCDGVPDRRPGGLMPLDSIGACNVPEPPPPGATSPCQAGTLTCAPGGVIDCEGDVLPQATTDACGEDLNCNGVLENQPPATDVRNCGGCGNDCYASGAANAIYSCDGVSCVFEGCQFGYLDGPGPGPCDTQCTPSPEICDGIDNDCDGLIDQADPSLVLPSPAQVCGTSPAASAAECTTAVQVQCSGPGQFSCTFPAGVCPGGCSGDDERCDGLDNDCDGVRDEGFPNVGRTCASDEGLPAPGHGACRRTGTYQCNAAGTATVCSVTTPAPCDDPATPGIDECEELCDGIDNDCDGYIDEPRSLDVPDDNEAYYYRPNVVQVSTSPARWIFAYEASRPGATPTSPGSGNGYVTSAPPGETLDATPACSEPDRLPWFNVTPVEVEQTCQMMGGFICTYSDVTNNTTVPPENKVWFEACRIPPRNPDCTWGYAPSTGGVNSPCVTTATASKRCNIRGDFLEPTGAFADTFCYADWAGLASPAGEDRIFDITGNLREIVKDVFANPDVYRVVGGAFNTQSEAGATCDFDFYAVSPTYKFFDTGFRCCFSTNPDP